MAALIELAGVSYTYPATDAPVLRELTLSVPGGQFCAVVGPNGAGKSTLCYTVAGFVPHFYHGDLSGSVRVAGIDVPASSLGKLAGEIGLVFANPFNQISGARFTVREEIAFGLENLGVPRDEMIVRIEEVLGLTRLTPLAERSPYALSGGQQQRVVLASVLVMHPKVLVLDEPTSQLDPVGTREVFAILAELAHARGTTILLTEHKLEWIAVYADRAILLQEGRIVRDGAPRAVFGDPALAEFGLAPTRYTTAARVARARDLARGEGPLPVTLQQATEYFR